MERLRQFLEAETRKKFRELLQTLQNLLEISRTATETYWEIPNPSEKLRELRREVSGTYGKFTYLRKVLETLGL